MPRHGDHPNLQITRLDYARTHAWWVRIYRKDPKLGRVCHSKVFSDGVWGGKAKALIAARQWRDEQLRTLPRTRRVRRRPGTGYVKRMRVWYYPRDGGEPRSYDAFVGWIRLEDGAAAGTRWSVEKWGVKKAKSETEQWFAWHLKELNQRLRQKRRATHAR